MKRSVSCGVVFWEVSVVIDPRSVKKFLREATNNDRHPARAH
jgi:hypothetical protein